MRALVLESMVVGGFAVFAVAGLKNNLWLVVAALVAHGVFDGLSLPRCKQPWRARVVAGVLPGVRRRSRRLSGYSPQVSRDGSRKMHGNAPAEIRPHGGNACIGVFTATDVLQRVWRRRG
jgi:hypothetical protein